MSSSSWIDNARDSDKPAPTLRYDDVINTPVFHSCSYCENIILRHDGEGPTHTWTLSPSPQHAQEAINHGCVLFDTLLHDRVNYPACIEKGSLILKPMPPHMRMASCGWDGASEGESDLESRGSNNRSRSSSALSNFKPVAVADLGESYEFLGFDFRATYHSQDLRSVLNEAKTQIGRCHLHHPCGYVSDISYTPTRLVKISLKEGRISARIHTCAPQDLVRYATLSYRWGQVKPVVINHTTLEIWSKELPLHALPSTIQDALIVTYALGLEYLWVDCLCILQNVSTDKAHEIAKMPQIYENAYVTISAAGSKNCDDGFLPRRPEYRGPLRVPRLRKSSSNGNEELVSIHLRANRYDQDKQPIHKRAWTLQEHALSPRMIVFGTGHIKTICRMSTKIIVGTDFMSSIKAHASLPSFKNENDPLSHWLDIVTDYTSRRLTDLNDRLPAISGLAQKFADILDDRYLAGMWSKHLLKMLQWIASSDPSKRTPTRLPGPTWSWCSLSRPVTWATGTAHSDTLSTKIISADIRPVFQDLPFGMIDAAALRLRGNIFKLSYTPPHPNNHSTTAAGPSDSQPAPTPHGRVEGFDGHFDIRYDFCPSSSFPADDDDRSPPPTPTPTPTPTQITCLELGRNHGFLDRMFAHGDFEVRGLLLAKIPGTSATYRRLGMWIYWAAQTGGGEEKGKGILAQWTARMDGRVSRVVTLV